MMRAVAQGGLTFSGKPWIHERRTAPADLAFIAPRLLAANSLLHLATQSGIFALNALGSRRCAHCQYRGCRDYGCYSDNQFHLQMPSSWLAYNGGIVHAGQMLVEVRAGKRLTSVKKV
jgi:hypothetical protein